MSADPERLVSRLAGGDQAASGELVAAMRPLVSGMARRFEGRVPRADLEQAGVIGLLRAARSFDPRQGTPFGGYAASFVMGEMLACVRQQATPVRVPRSVADDERAVTAAIDALTGDLGRSPTVDEIASRSELGQDAVLDALRLRLAARPVPIHDVDQGELSLSDQALSQVEQRLDLGARLDRLDQRSRRVVVLRFGLELSQREIADRLGISQMHVSRLLRASLATLAEEER